MPSAADHLPDDGTGLARLLRNLAGRLQRLEAAPRVAAVAALTPWQLLILPGDWAPAGGTWATPQYRRQTTSAVQLLGSLTPGTLTAGTVIATLPAGYTPVADLEFRTGGGAPTATVDLTVTAAGAITIQGTTGTVTRISLTGISLPA